MSSAQEVSVLFLFLVQRRACLEARAPVQPEARQMSKQLDRTIGRVIDSLPEYRYEEKNP
jgi:hypothetical protein